MNWLKRNDLAVFLFLSFAFSWWVWPLHFLNPESTPMIPWGPFIAVFIVLGLTQGWIGIKGLLSDMFRWRVNGRWYLLAVVLPIAVTFTAAYLNTMLGGPAISASVFDELRLFVPALLVTILFAGPFTEEPAWRGFFLPRLQEKYTPLVASLIIGGVWWLWHMPLMISDSTGQRPPLQYLFSILAYSLLFTWTYNQARSSVFIVTLMHGVTNTIASFVFRGLFGEYYQQLWWLYAGLWWVAASWIVFRPSARATIVEPMASTKS